MKIEHPNNNKQPAIISIENQDIVDDLLWETGKEFRKKHGRQPTNMETYTITLSALRNKRMSPDDKNQAEHYLWFIATNID